MATSGTFAFNPSLADLVVNAFGRIQIRRTELLAEHLGDAATEANLLLTEWSNKQVNLWTSTLVSISATAGVVNYALPSQVVTVLIAYVSTLDGSGTAIDRVITPISTTDYAAYPNKAQQGQPLVFWLDRQIVPKINLWPAPDGNYTIKLQCVRQVQDALLTGGTQLEVPYRWVDVFTTGLAARLAQIYRPDQAAKLEARYERAWNIAATQDVEDVPIFITPALGSYYE